jgi:hypothetical protein
MAMPISAACATFQYYQSHLYDPAKRFTIGDLSIKLMKDNLQNIQDNLALMGLRTRLVLNGIHG